MSLRSAVLIKFSNHEVFCDDCSNAFQGHFTSDGENADILHVYDTLGDNGVYTSVLEIAASLGGTF